MKVWKTAKDECQTRAPIHWEWNPINWLLDLFNRDPTAEANPARFAKFLQSLQDDPPAVMAGSGFAGVIPFDWGYRGAVKGEHNPLLGASFFESPDEVTGWGRLPPDQLTERIALLEQYAGTLRSLGKVKRVMPYIDFGTQLFGRHNRPNKVAQSVWGFWEFYDHWAEYAEPTGPFGLGPKPADPTTWLTQWDDHDPDGKQWPDLPDELAGFSFVYEPIKPSYGPTYRYGACLNTAGWALWWKQVVQWMARVGYDGAFIDNAVFRFCWNRECQAGYRAWLEENFTATEIGRYFTTTTNNLLTDPSLEGPWFQEIAGQWRAAAWGSKSNSTIFPDTDAHRGHYSCRIEGPGTNDVAHFSHSTQPVPADEDLRLTFYYKTQGIVEVKAIISIAVASPQEKLLPLKSSWQQAQFQDFHTLPDSSGKVGLNLRFEVKGSGTVWLDEFWLGKADQRPEFPIELWRPSDDPAAPLRLWTARTYWNQVADEKLGYLRQQARRVNQKFELFTNGFREVNADYCLIEGQAIAFNHQRLDVGFYPGVYAPYDPPVEIGGGTKANPITVTQPILVTNIFDYKYIHSRRAPESFGYHMPQWSYAAQNGFYDHNPDSALLNLAETAAFGGGAGCDAAFLRSAYGRYGGDPTLLTGAAVAIRETEKHFWTFIEAHQHRYSGYRTHADVGIVYHDLPDMELQNPAMFESLLNLTQELASRGILWDVLTENRCNKQNFSRLRVLIYQDVTRISAAEAQTVLEFIEQGGLVIAAGIVGDMDEWFRLRLPNPTQTWPPVGLPPTGTLVRPRPPAFQQQRRMGMLIYQPTALEADMVITAMETHLGRGVQMIGNVPTAAVERLRVNAWNRQEGGGTITLHVVNYNVPLGIDKGNQVQPLINVHVSVPMPLKMQVQSVRLYSPESSGPPQAVPFSITNGLVTFVIPSLRIYTVAVIE